MLFTDEKNIYRKPLANNHNDRIWASGRKSIVASKRWLVEREKFAKHVMVSVEDRFGKLHFVAEKAKV